MKVLFLATPPDQAAATRFRISQLLPFLQRMGIETELRPFLDERGFNLLYKHGAASEKVLAALHAFAGRLQDVVANIGASAVFVQREAALVGPPAFEWIFKRAGVPLIFDLDDAIWVPYASPTYGALASRLLKAPQKARSIAQWATTIFAGNEYIASWARNFNEHVEIFPTVVDTEVFRPSPRERDVPVLGWVGTHSTVQYLNSILPALRRVASQRRFRLLVVGGSLEVTGLDAEIRTWTLGRELGDFQDIDIGLYPLVEDAWSLGKSGFKAVQYMACGTPFVASPVGVTTTLVRHGDNGFLARTEDEWVASLISLIDAPRLRVTMGSRGRAEAVAHWSVAAHAARWTQAIVAAIQRGGRR